jgi:hypothetical protein
MADMSMNNTQLRLKINDLQLRLSERDKTLERQAQELQRRPANNARLAGAHDETCQHGAYMHDHCEPCAEGDW